MRWFYFPLILALMSLTMSTARSDEADEAIKKASQALKDHDFEAVLKAAAKAVELDPKKAMGWYFRGEANSHFRKHEAAIKDYDKAYELDKTLIDAVNQRGGARFCLGMVKESIEDFEKFIEAKPKAYDSHWRYGISLYYAGRFADGAKQFKAGEIAFGDDVENVFWHYLCNAKVDGLEKARKAVLSVKPDRRVPMMKVYDLIRGKVKPDEVIETSEKAKLEGEDKQEALFYAHLYVGLNYEADGNAKKCLEHLTTAVEKHKISHYMWDVGNVHLKLLKKK
jgi:lipoprotein NlpI